MKKIQNSILKAAMVVFAFAAVATLDSCNPDPCKDETCNDHGTPTEVDKKTCECDCNPGYEGDKCETEMRKKFLGTFQISGTASCGVSGSSSIPAFSAVIAESSSAVTKITITLSGSTVITGTVDGTGFTIDSQSTGGYTYTGSGSISGTTVSLTINEYDASVPETCVYSLSGPKL